MKKGVGRGLPTPFRAKKIFEGGVYLTVEDEIDDDAEVDGYESVQSGGKGEVARGTHYRGATADGTPAEKIIGRMNVIGRMNMISMMNMISRLNMISRMNKMNRMDMMGMMDMISRMYMIGKMNMIGRMNMIVLKESTERRCWPPSSNINNDTGLPYSPKSVQNSGIICVYWNPTAYMTFYCFFENLSYFFF